MQQGNLNYIHLLLKGLMHALHIVVYPHPHFIIFVYLLSLSFNHTNKYKLVVARLHW